MMPKCKDVGHCIHPDDLDSVCQRCGEVVKDKDEAMPDKVWIAGRATCSGMWSTNPEGIDKAYNPVGPFVRADLPSPPVRGDEIENALQWFEKIAAKYTGLGILSARMQPAILRRALLQPQPGIPDGYVLVPKEPTEAMFQNPQVSDAIHECEGDRDQVFRVYRAMIAAATSEQDKGDAS